MRIRLLVALLLALACLGQPARADEFNPAGLAADSRAYAQSLTSRFPAGGSPLARRAAEDRAAAAPAATAMMVVVPSAPLGVSRCNGGQRGGANQSQRDSAGHPFGTQH